MLSKDIRKKFLEFFRAKGHEIVPSDSLVPERDPTLLFTSAGMNQFKEQFLGHNVTYKKAASSQKCLRTADLEKVGKTPSHHTFFEMLGNFSFGDYFKEEAIRSAWHFMTKELGIPKEKLWVSVYEEDAESYKIWKDLIGVPAEKIKKLDAKENFWPSNAPKDGPNGPCGPCSEIFYDYGNGTSVEVWNLVFTQFDRKEGGKLEALPTKNIDTGMGLERITAVMQGVKTNFETDLFRPIIEELKGLDLKLETPDLNAIADHMRAAVFAIVDGVAPSNEAHGYVIRKLIRRAHLRVAGGQALLYKLVPKITEIMKDAYPELVEKREEISLIVKEEEERFTHALSVAMPVLEEDLKRAKDNVLSGEAIFKLADTYGLPPEVIESVSRRKKVKLDMEGFEKLMAERRLASRKKSKITENVFGLDLLLKVAPPTAEPSMDVPLRAQIAYLIKIDAKGKKSLVTRISKGDNIQFLTDPPSAAFYKEAGGQAGDSGFMKDGDNALAEIYNTVKVNDKVVHEARVVRGSFSKGDSVEIDLDIDRKENIARNHTATHLLHSALRRVLGEHVHQSGSLVAAERLRFDFTHMKKMTEREIELVESAVNECIKKSVLLKKEEKTLDEAKKEGAVALFGEKYGERVRVVSAGDFSKEVCGGTHVENTKDIGIFKITREGSVASGVRRIEALTGEAARNWIEENEKQKGNREKVLKEKEKEKKLEAEKLRKAGENIDLIIKDAKKIKATAVIIREIANANMGILRSLADKIRTKEKSCFILLAGKDQDKVNLVLSGTKDLISGGFDASKEIKTIAKMVGGSGGGRPDFAQAGGKDPSKLKKVFEIAENSATNIIGGLK